MLLCLVVSDERDLDLVVLGNGQVILNNEALPDLDDLLEERLGVDELSRLLEQLAHVEVAGAHVDALRAILDALLVDTTRKLIERLLVRVRPVLCHEQTAERDVQRGSEAFELFPRHRGVLGSGPAIVALSRLHALQQVPVCGDQKLLGLLKLGAAHADVRLGEDEVGWEQLD